MSKIDRHEKTWNTGDTTVSTGRRFTYIFKNKVLLATATTAPVDGIVTARIEETGDCVEVDVTDIIEVW